MGNMAWKCSSSIFASARMSGGAMRGLPAGLCRNVSAAGARHHHAPQPAAACSPGVGVQRLPGFLIGLACPATHSAGVIKRNA